MQNLYKNCNLCPRQCGVNRLKGELGFCGADTTAEINRIGLHFMEEPVISGTKGSGTVFFTHCSLGCIFCQNSDISRRVSSGKKYSANELAKQSGVSLRSIQMYEQRNKDINKAQMETVNNLAKVLGCKMEDLMEY